MTKEQALVLAQKTAIGLGLVPPDSSESTRSYSVDGGWHFEVGGHRFSVDPHGRVDVESIENSVITTG